ncbi:CLASRP [Branchiostoma lanceolatum]|uniref:CLASRP protein n=1 Tax=Branchiostoma lanceolatum TaxID=7740 RepID=A0A8K0ERZ6_BRALA|nr:CLASRP [Branchiostoma lanceolatum]
MWHEARRQEKKLRGMMVDYRKRAERRREYYEKIKMDPTQFLRVYGQHHKINLDPAVSFAAEGPGTMMPWQGDNENMVDRFDVRAHLDFIPEYKGEDSDWKNSEEYKEEQKANYERYRTMVLKEVQGLTEEQVLQQIFIEETYGEIPRFGTTEEEKNKLAKAKATIGYTYEDSTISGEGQPSLELEEEEEEEEEEEDSDGSISDTDLDVIVDPNELTKEQLQAYNKTGTQYGIPFGDYVKNLRKDKEEQDRIQHQKELEEEKALYSGRKSRRERRAFREKRLRGRKISPPSYARRDSPTYQPYRRESSESSSRSRSHSPVNEGQVTFITSFGGEESPSRAQQASIGPHLPSAHPPQHGSSSRTDQSRAQSRSVHQSFAFQILCHLLDFKQSNALRVNAGKGESQVVDIRTF